MCHYKYFVVLISCRYVDIYRNMKYFLLLRVSMMSRCCFFFVTFVNIFNFFNDDAFFRDFEIFIRDICVFSDRDSRHIVIICRRCICIVVVNVNQVFIIIRFSNFNIVMTIFFDFQQMTSTSIRSIIIVPVIENEMMNDEIDFEE